MMTITSNTEEAICTLTLKVSTLNITSIQGENVSIAVSQLWEAYRRLMLAEKVPHDIANCLINVIRMRVQQKLRELLPRLFKSQILKIKMCSLQPV